MFVDELVNTNPVRLLEAVSVDSPAFREWFSGSNVVDAQGNPLPVYHGTARPDRVGTRFRKNRATSGPMSYFTDDPEVASGYAEGKADTSNDADTDYPSWFTVVVKGYRKPLTIAQYWYTLSSSEQQKIAELAPRVSNDDNEEITLLDPDDPRAGNGLGAYRQHLREQRGNVLAALVEEWLTSGGLFGQEEEFLKVLKLAGVTTYVRLFDPRSSMAFVYQVFLAIRNPLDTSAMSQNVIDRLAAVGSKQRFRQPKYAPDQWSKSSIDPQMWLQNLQADLKDGTSYVWTSIPDWVTATLQSMGYDGIKDTGGKRGGQGHTVWIPFHEYQVKSAISNKKFDPSKSGLHH